MSLVEGALHRCPASLELSAHSCILPYYRSIHGSSRLYVYADLTIHDDEEKREKTRKGFSIRVPTIPTLEDIESGRRKLESAFHALSFEVPKVPLESALQGLIFGIFKLSILKQVLGFDITGFAATKWKKPLKDVEDTEALDVHLYPRCTWPRTLKETHVEEASSISTMGSVAGKEEPSPCVIEGGPRCAWPRKTVSAKLSQPPCGNYNTLNRRSD